MKIDKKMIEEEVQKLDPTIKKSDETFKVATILLSGLNVGADVESIAKFLNLNIKDVRKYEKNLRKSKIWQGKKTVCDWFGKDGGISFWLDVLVAQGFVERTEGKSNKNENG